MFSGFFGLGGNEEQNKQSDDDTSASSSARTSGAGTFGVDIWGLANAVTQQVRAQAESVVKSVAETDWRSELLAFSKEAAEEGKHISQKTAEAVEHLPEQAERVAAQLSHTTPAVSTKVVDVGDSIKTFGTTLLQGTREFIEQLRDAVEDEIAAAARETRTKSKPPRSAVSGMNLGSGGKYNRFEVEVANMQRDSSTYCDEPSDMEDFKKWAATFSLTLQQPAIDTLLAENAFMAELHARLVPVIVENEDFWTRYFYRYSKLQAKEEARKQLAARALASQDDDEELGWDDELDTPVATSSPAIQQEPVNSTATATAATADQALHINNSVADTVQEHGNSRDDHEGHAKSEAREVGGTVALQDNAKASPADSEPVQGQGTVPNAHDKTDVDHSHVPAPATTTTNVQADAEAASRRDSGVSVVPGASDHGDAGSEGSTWCVVSGSAQLSDAEHNTRQTSPGTGSNAGSPGSKGATEEQENSRQQDDQVALDEQAPQTSSSQNNEPALQKHEVSKENVAETISAPNESARNPPETADSLGLDDDDDIDALAESLAPHGQDLSSNNNNKQNSNEDEEEAWGDWD